MRAARRGKQQARGKLDPEYELIDTGVFNEATAISMCLSNMPRAAPEDILIKITAWNRGPEEAQLDLLPTLWFRNIWSFGEKHGHPKLARIADCVGAAVISTEDSLLRKALAPARRRAGNRASRRTQTNFQRRSCSAYRMKRHSSRTASTTIWCIA